jgi:hypothetical protein
MRERTSKWIKLNGKQICPIILTVHVDVIPNLLLQDTEGYEETDQFVLRETPYESFRLILGTKLNGKRIKQKKLTTVKFGHITDS